MVHGTLTREAMHEPSLRETRRGASQGDDRSGRYTLVRIRPRDEYSSSTMNLPTAHQAPPSSAATPKIPHQSAPAPLALQYFTERSTSPALTRARRPARLLFRPAAQMIASSNVNRGASAAAPPLPTPTPTAAPASARWGIRGPVGARLWWRARRSRRTRRSNPTLRPYALSPDQETGEGCEVRGDPPDSSLVRLLVAPLLAPCARALCDQNGL